VLRTLKARKTSLAKGLCPDRAAQGAVGCTVTTEEAVLLAQFDSDYGWERYRKAGITVLDTKDSPGRPVDLSGKQTVI
jgi:hypothetical protein